MKDQTSVAEDPNQTKDDKVVEKEKLGNEAVIPDKSLEDEKPAKDEDAALLSDDDGDKECGEAPDKEISNDLDKDMDDPISMAAKLSLDEDKGGAEESKASLEESKTAANQRLKDQRQFEFLRTTKFSDYYQRLIPNKHLKSI